MFFALTVLAALNVSAKADPRLAVLEVKPRVGVAESLSQGVSDMVVSEVRKQAVKYSVISSDEIRSLLALEKQRQQLGCDNMACLAEIGGALGAQQMVSGSLGLFGDLYVLTLKRVDVAHAQVIREASGRLDRADERGLPDLVAKLCASLFSEVLPGPADPPPPDLFAAQEEPLPHGAHAHALGWTLIATALLCAATSASTAGVAASFGGEFSLINQNAIGAQPASQGYADLQTSRVLAGVAIGTGIAALLAAGGAVLAW